MNTSTAPGRPCGKGHIAAGKKCRLTSPGPNKAALAVGLTAGAVGTALLYKGSRKAILNTPSATKSLAQKAVTETVHKLTAPKPSMRLQGEALNNMRPPSKTVRLHRIAQTANREAEQAISKAAQIELERTAVIGEAMHKSGKAARASLESGMRRHNLTVEKLRRKYEPGYRKSRKPLKLGRSDNYIPLYAPVILNKAR